MLHNNASHRWVTLCTVLLGFFLFLSPRGIHAAPSAVSDAGPSLKDVGPGAQWDLLLGVEVTSTASRGNKFVSLDLFDTDASVISGLKRNGVFVACYFSAGTYENWRPDRADFRKADKGKAMDGWPGERWIDTNSKNVRKIMRARMDLAVQKGCSGLDPDNVDAYGNENGLGLKKADAVEYLQYLAKRAKTRGLPIGLKNAGSIVPRVLDVMDFSINEQCSQYEECRLYRPFLQAGKPVFNVEYPKGQNTNNNKTVKKTTKYCKNDEADGFSIILKNMNLNSWVQRC